MKITEIINRLENTQTLHRKEVIGWLKDVSPERDLMSVDKMKVGDTFFHKLVGGKSRPWVTLWVKKGYIGAATLTHSELPHGYKCEDRFWGGSFIGPTLCIFEVERVQDAVYYPYTNLKHLKTVRDSIKKMWG